MPAPARRRRATAAALVAAVVVGASISAVVEAPPAGAEGPDNDDLGQATPIGLGDTLDGDTAAATLEDGETTPPASCGLVTNTIWYRFDAASDGPTVAATLSSTPRDTVIAIYTATAGGYPLDLVGCNDDGGPGKLSRLRFAAAAGTSYFVQVGHYGGGSQPTEPGPLQLRLVAEVTTTTVLTASSSSPGRVDLHVVVAREGDEDGPPSGVVVVREGTAVVADLELVDGAGGRRLRATAGTHSYTAHFEPAATEETESTSEPVTVVVSPPPRPGNDDFADAEPLAGVSGSTTDVDLDGATAEPLDPELFSSPLDDASVWYRWTAPVSDSYRFAVQSTESDAEPALGVLLGRTLGRLHVLEASSSSGGQPAVLTFAAVAGRTYHLLVDAAVRGPASLAWTRGPVVADTTTGLAVSSTGPYAVTLTSSTTREPPEEVDGTAAFYRGDDLLGVVQSDGSGRPASLTVTAQRPGPTAYRVEFYPEQDAVRPSEAVQSFQVPQPARPPNDDFDEAQPISGSAEDAGVAGTTFGATADPGTPPSSLPAPGADATVWFRWTAPSSGSFEFTTTADEGDPVMRAFAGTTLRNLRVLDENDDLDDDPSRSRVGVSARAGRTYYLLVDGYDLDELGPFRLTWGPVAPEQTVPAPALRATVSGRTVTLTAAVGGSASSHPAGLVEFVEGRVSRGVVPVGADGVARAVLSGVTPGRHSYRAVVVPDDHTIAQASSAVATATVARPTRTTIYAPLRVPAGRRPRVGVMVTMGGYAAAGRVRITVNGRSAGVRVLDVGYMTLVLPPVRRPRIRVVASYLGNTEGAPSSATRTISVRRA